jgi:hypothetical protein
MDKDDEVKTNRLALLAGVTGLFAGIADFSRLVLGTEENSSGQQSGARSQKILF